MFRLLLVNYCLSSVKIAFWFSPFVDTNFSYNPESNIKSVASFHSQLHRIQKIDPGVLKPPVIKLHSLPEINIDSYNKFTTAKGKQRAKMYWQL